MDYRSRRDDTDALVRRLEMRVADLEQQARRAERVGEVLADRLQDTEHQLQGERVRMRELAELLLEVTRGGGSGGDAPGGSPPTLHTGQAAPPSFASLDGQWKHDTGRAGAAGEPTSEPRFCYGCGAHRVHCARFCQMCGITFPSAASVSPQREAPAGRDHERDTQQGGMMLSSTLDQLLRDPASTTRRSAKRLFP